MFMTHTHISVEWVSGIKLKSDLISFVLVNFHLHLTILLSSDLWIQKWLKCLSSEFSRDRRGNPGTGKWRAGVLGAPRWPAVLVKVALRWSLVSVHFVGPRCALRWQTEGVVFPLGFRIHGAHLTQRERVDEGSWLLVLQSLLWISVGAVVIQASASVRCLPWCKPQSTWWEKQHWHAC